MKAFDRYIFKRIKCRKDFTKKEITESLLYYLNSFTNSLVYLASKSSKRTKLIIFLIIFFEQGLFLSAIFNSATSNARIITNKDDDYSYQLNSDENDHKCLWLKNKYWYISINSSNIKNR